MDVPKAFVIFQGSGRTRVRIPALKYDPEGLARCARTLAEAPGVVSVSASPVTGTVLILHDGGREAVLERLKAAGFPAVDAVAPAWADDRLPSWRYVVAAVFLLLAVQQASRGNVFGPASSLVAAALAVISPGRGFERF